VEKKKLKRFYESQLSEKEIEKAKIDEHAKRAPRPCGFTIHVARGCSGSCLYCYVESKPRPAELSPKALVYSLLLNPRFKIEESFIAIGSVCEPLDFPEYTKELLKEIYLLRNPVQLSTKEVNHTLVRELKKVDTLISMCVPLDELCKKFEPKRPSISERLEFCKEVHGAVFLRPILLMIDEELYKRGLERIAEYTDRIILGNLRLTKNVKKKLGIERLTKSYFQGKKILEDYAKKELDLIVFRSACCSNAYKHRVPCWNECWRKGFCSKCPNECWSKEERRNY
jgi:DNA repair photolyase